MTSFRIELRLHAESAFHIGTGTGVGKLVDRSALKDHLGQLYLPGSSLRGKARQACERVARGFDLRVCDRGEPCLERPLCIACSLFGSGLRESPTRFSDALPSQSPTQLVGRDDDLQRPAGAPNTLFPVEWRPAIKVDRAWGVVEENHLFTTEVGGRGLEYHAAVEGWSGGFVPLRDTLLGVPAEFVLLLASLPLVSHVGGSISRGLGRVRVDFRAVTLDDQDFDRARVAPEVIRELEWYDIYGTEPRGSP